MNAFAPVSAVFDAGIELESRYSHSPLARGAIVTGTVLVLLVVFALWVTLGVFVLCAYILAILLPRFLIGWAASAGGYQVTSRRRR